MRAQFLPEVQPVYAGYVAWRATLDEADVPPALWREMVELYAFCLPEGEQLISYAVPGTRQRHRGRPPRLQHHLVPAGRPRARWPIFAPTPVAGTTPNGIPPPLIRPDVIARIKADAHATIAPQVAEIFARTTPFFQPIYDLASPRLVFGRVALAGDAAFVARPHAGAGTTKAALDAACLADSIRDAGDDLAAGLQRYERMQLPFGKALVEVNREEGAYLSAQLKPRSERTPAELTRDIGAVVHAHIARSDQVGDIVAAHGLTGFTRLPLRRGREIACANRNTATSRAAV